MTRRYLRAARGIRAILVLVGLGLTSLLTASPALAQIAAALGKPLPSPDLPVGTVSVRIVAGSSASPVVGTDVTLLVNNAPRAARTDSAGRASFAGLPAGAAVVAKVLDEDKVEHASEQFTVPDSGGTRVMITTKPWQAGAGGDAPFAGGGAPPNPRQMSGEVRPQRGDPSGTITVRLTYDDFNDSPEGVPVALVGYAADDTTSYQVANSDKAGRVQFSDLDRSGGTAYYAFAQLPRNGAIDRLMSSYVVLDSQTGVRVLLSSEKRSSKAPPIDDITKFDQPVATPAGKVRVVVDGGLADLSATVALIDAATKKQVAQAKVEAAAPDPSHIQQASQFEPDAKLPAGTLDIEVGGGPGQSIEPLEGIQIRVIPATSSDPAGGLASVTGAGGTVRMALQVKDPQKAVFVINGKPFTTEPFDLAKSGGKLRIRALWEATGRPQALFDLATPGQVVFAECTWSGKTYRSMPFQLVEGAGAKITVYAYPRVMFRFQLQGFVDDDKLAVQGRFEVTNYAWSPYRGGPDGLVVPMPRGFKGGVVFDPDQNEVAVAAGEGLRIIRPLPPVVGRTFHGGFSLPVEGGNVNWALDLPMGSWQSELVLRQTPGMSVHAPPNAATETRTVAQGTFILIGPISIGPKQSMVMSVAGLPSPPLWRTWVSAIIGVLVVVVMLGGVGLALFGKNTAGASASTLAGAARRQRLLDELVELERSGGNPKRRDQVLAELEELWS